MSTENIFYPLITYSQVKTLVPEINNNVNNDLIDYSIKQEQKKVIRPLLGYSFYNQLQEQVSGSSLSTDNEIIYNDYIQIIISLSVYKRLIVSTSYQLENSGLRIKVSDVSSAAEPKDLIYLRNLIQDDIDYYKNELIKYITTNPSKFPLYFNDTDNRINTVDKNRRIYNFGFNISKI